MNRKYIVVTKIQQAKTQRISTLYQYYTIVPQKYAYFGWVSPGKTNSFWNTSTHETMWGWPLHFQCNSAFYNKK